MKDLNSLMIEIVRLTSNMETNYPELYQFLDENPMTISSEMHPQIDKETMTEYLDSLENILKGYIENHPKIKSYP